MKIKLRMTLAALAISAMPAIAGPVTDFENAFRQAYGSYRASLFKTNMKDQGASAQAINAFATKWTGLMNEWKASPPPQYADDPKWKETISGVDTLIGKATGEIGSGKLAEAHETLEGVRDLVWDMHKRNNVVTFSDRMNAYHLEMEHVLGMNPASADIAMMREKAVLLHYLAGEILAFPPAEAAGNAEFEGLAKTFAASTGKFLEATRAGDNEAIKAAFRGLKPAYSKFFLKFG